jgi:CDP-2,3-bis-(O-geranylgeranyl)-sn-glycerol synthase
MEGLFVFLAVLGAPVVHAPVLRWDLLRGLKRPLDGGRSWRGARLFGDNKTVRGALCMVAGCLLATVALSAWPWWWDGLPDDLRDAGPVVVGLLVGVGIVIGELPNSFLKRRLGVAPGTQRGGATGLALSALDQFDLVLGVWVALLPVWMMPAGTLAVALVAVTAVHLVLNVVGHRIGARAAPV